MSYRETFVTLPVTTRDGDEELTISAWKVSAIRGGAARCTVTYTVGATPEQVVVPLPAAEVREMVLRAMTDWS